MEVIEIRSDSVALGIAPALGGGVARFDRLVEGRGLPVFRPWDGTTRDPNALGCYPLLPWSNRIGRGGITQNGRFWPLPRNVPGEAFPLHGEGWQAAWRVEAVAPDRVSLGFDSRALPPFDYRARLDYSVAGDALSVALTIDHRGVQPAWYGAGLHPWLPRSPATTLAARATHVWLEDERHLPTERIRVAARPDWDFRHPRRLPAGWVNNAFTGWDGLARIEWPDRGLALAIESDRAIGVFILFAPGAAADFFCFEPVSHPVDAFDLPDRDGLVRLEAGQRLATTTVFRALRL